MLEVIALPALSVKRRTSVEPKPGVVTWVVNDPSSSEAPPQEARNVVATISSKKENLLLSLCRSSLENNTVTFGGIVIAFALNHLLMGL